MTLKNFEDPNIAAVLLKKYLRDLPEPIFTEELYPIIRRCPLNNADESSTIQYIQNTIIPALPPCSMILLSHVLRQFAFILLSVSLLIAIVIRTDARCLVTCINQSDGRAQSRPCVMPESRPKLRSWKRFGNVCRPGFFITSTSEWRDLSRRNNQILHRAVL